MDIEYNLQTLIDEKESTQSMANYAQGIIESEVGNGILTAENYGVEVDSYDVSMNLPGLVEKNLFLLKKPSLLNCTQ